MLRKINADVFIDDNLGYVCQVALPARFRSSAKTL